MRKRGSISSLNRPKIDFLVVLGILGAFTFFLGFALLMPAIIDLIYGENTWHTFLISAGMAFGVGGTLWYFFKPQAEIRIREGFLVVSLTWLILSLVGALPFVISGILPSYTDAVFETMSGLTTTGSTILGGTTSDGIINPAIEALPKSFLFWRSLAHWLGGMGIIVFYIAILPLLGVGGVQLFKAEAPGPVSDKITPRVKETAKYLWIIYLSMTFLQIISLRIAGMQTFDSICHAFTTMPTGGFSTKNASIAHFDNALIHYIIIFFMFIAGINFSLHFRLISGDFKAYVKDAEFRVYLFITLVITTIVFISLSFENNIISSQGLKESLFNTVAILTSTGFVLGDYEAWPVFVQMILLTVSTPVHQ